MQRTHRRKITKKRANRNCLILVISIILIASSLRIYSVLHKKTVLVEDKLPSSKTNVNDSGTRDKTEVVDNSENSTFPSLEGTAYKDKYNNIIIKNTDDILVLVNKSRNLPSDYKQNDLIVPDVEFSFKENLQKKYMRKDAAEALEELFNDAKKHEINLYAVSGYRSYQRQSQIFENKAEKYGRETANKTSAVPGQSEHQTGLAMDVSCSSVNYQLTERFGQTPEGMWLKENAHRFGFIVRYPKDKIDITGYSYEPWHIRYVGKEAAKIIMENNITFEEYFTDSNSK